jgi:UDP-N-acetylglucosamine--dolichyl-phosphate N-acetylglucosaminephosphotransferase
MTLLGFADDVLDLPWRYKFILPVFASLPLLAMYTGTSAIKLPSLLGSLLVQRGSLTWLGGLLDPLLVTIDTAAYGHIVDLGAWYLVYMGLLGVFATNAINIYAGINGLEAGQAAVISIAVITANLTELSQGRNEAHLFSALLGMPFLAVNLAVLYHNTYPAAVFVGDTFCYFAGMTLAVHGILGHMSKTLLIFFAPQVFNFVYSLPQIAKVYPCPRHRLPDFDPVTGLLRPSTFEVPLARTGGKAPQASPPSTTTPATEGGSGKGRSSSSGPKRRKSSSTPTAAVTGAEGTAAVATPRRYDNFTLINLVLRITGPMHERTT